MTELKLQDFSLLKFKDIFILMLLDLTIYPNIFSNNLHMTRGSNSIKSHCLWILNICVILNWSLNSVCEQ